MWKPAPHFLVKRRFASLWRISRALSSLKCVCILDKQIFWDIRLIALLRTQAAFWKPALLGQVQVCILLASAEPSQVALADWFSPLWRISRAQPGEPPSSPKSYDAALQERPPADDTSKLRKQVALASSTSDSTSELHWQNATSKMAQASSTSKIALARCTSQ